MSTTRSTVRSAVHSTTREFDAEQFRALFPMLTRVTHLASCSLGARSTELDVAMTHMLDSMSEHGAPWDLWVDQVEEARARFAALINADVSEIAIVPNASIGAFQVASTLDYSARSGIVTTDMEFPSVANVWLAQRERGATLRYATEAGYAVTAAAYADIIDTDVRLVSAPLVSYKNGAVFPVKEIGELAHAAGARFFVDAYQGAGVLPIDVRELDCDYLVAGTLKYLLGLPGLAFLYLRGGLRDDIAPTMTGWFGQANPFAFDPYSLDLASDAKRMESGTPAIPAAYGANAGLRLLDGVDQEAGWRHVKSLAAVLAERVAALGIPVSLPVDEDSRGPQVALRPTDPAGLAEFLKSRQIFTSPRGELVRLSLHYYNTVDDIDACVAALADYLASSGDAR